MKKLITSAIIVGAAFAGAAVAQDYSSEEQALLNDIQEELFVDYDNAPEQAHSDDGPAPIVDIEMKPFKREVAYTENGVRKKMVINRERPDFAVKVFTVSDHGNYNFEPKVRESMLFD